MLSFPIRGQTVRIGKRVIEVPARLIVSDESVTVEYRYNGREYYDLMSLKTAICDDLGIPLYDSQSRDPEIDTDFPGSGPVQKDPLYL